MFTHHDHGITLPKITRQTTTSGRKYFTPEENQYPSITTVLGITNKEGIQKWRERVGEAEANKISQQAANRGTAIHKLCEDYLNNDEDWKGKHMPSNLFTFNTIKPIIDKSINNIWMQEEFLYSDHLKCAGQVDCIAEFDGELSIIDFKTSRKPKQEEWILNYFIQAAFYAAAFYERTGVPIKQGVILIAVDDNEPQIFKIPTFEYLPHFKAVRNKYAEIYENQERKDT
jgi:hypothetical protein